MSACLFCQIIEKKIPADIIFENERMLIFKDIYPQAKEHFLAIPKNHYQNFSEFGESEDFLPFIRDFHGFVSKKEGFRIVTNQGEVSGQSVFHVHFHILSGEKLQGFGA